MLELTRAALLSITKGMGGCLFRITRRNGFDTTPKMYKSSTHLTARLGLTRCNTTRVSRRISSQLSIS